jgi:alpha 1,2-mannosyltransferase
MQFLSDNGGETYNKCHCRSGHDEATMLIPAVWSNFEIGDLNFWRSKPYMDYFEHLDKAGGFYYERWVRCSAT